MRQLTEEAVLTELRNLPTESWREVYDFIGRLKATPSPQPRRGSAEAILPLCGAWEMSPEERRRIERQIDALRHLEEDAG